MPIQVPHWNDYLLCPICFKEYNKTPRSPINLGCGHSLCNVCFTHLNPKQCPFDQCTVFVDPDNLVVNTALLLLSGVAAPDTPYHPPIIEALSEAEKNNYDKVIRIIEELARCLKYNSTIGGKLSKPMQKKIVAIIQCTLLDNEGRNKVYKAVRSLAERTVNEIILQYQNPQQLGPNLWAAVRARGCQFLGPAMQEEVLKLVLLALEDGSALSRKVLVMFVVQRLEPLFPQASKTSIGHVVQLLYRASCFKMSKRENDSSLMQLKEEFRTYDTLRREHDSQIVQIATEAGLRIAPDQWSSLLYGDLIHKSHMQSIIDKLQIEFNQSVQELTIAFQRSGDPTRAQHLSPCLQLLASIDPYADTAPSWEDLANALDAVKEIVNELLFNIYHQNSSNKEGNNQQGNANAVAKSPTVGMMAGSNSNMSLQDEITNIPREFLESLKKPDLPRNYKVVMCNSVKLDRVCFHGATCHFAHNARELEIYRILNSKIKSNGLSTILNIINNHTPDRPPVNTSGNSNVEHTSSVQTQDNGNTPTVRSQRVAYKQTKDKISSSLTTHNVANCNVPIAKSCHVTASPLPIGPGVPIHPQPSTSYSASAVPSLFSVSECGNYGPQMPNEGLRTVASVLQWGGVPSHDIFMELQNNLNNNESSMSFNSRAQLQASNPNNRASLASVTTERVFVRSDSILTGDAVPFETQGPNSFGPISRQEAGRNILVQGTDRSILSHELERNLTISEEVSRNMLRGESVLMLQEADRNVPGLPGRIISAYPMSNPGNMELANPSLTTSVTDCYEIGMLHNMKALEQKLERDLIRPDNKDWSSSDDSAD